MDYVSGTKLWEEHYAYINKTAESLARSYWVVEAEDVMQEIWEWLWKVEASLMDKSVAYIKTCIKNVARNYALKQRDNTLVQTDRFYYSFDEVRELLPALFQEKDYWAEVLVPDGYETDTANDNVEVVCDLSLAFSKLSKAQQSILERKYGNDEALAEAKDRQQASRALKKLVITLNGTTDKRAKAHEGPGNRKAISNAAARYESERWIDD